MSISNNALTFYHTYTIESKKKSVYFTDFSIKTSFSLEYRDRFERLLGFKKEAGYPRFKSRRGEQSSYHCTGVSAGDDFVKVPKMKKIKAVMHRKIEGKVKSITLSMDACGDYWASVLYEDGLPEAVPATCVRQTKTVGVDVGIETFCTCSDGEKIKSPKALKRAE